MLVHNFPQKAKIYLMSISDMVFLCYFCMI